MKIPVLKGFNEDSFQKYLRNTGWVMFGKVLSMLVGFVIARYLGPVSFGELSFSDAFVFLFAAVGTLGLDSFIVREIINEPDRINEILGTSFWMRAVVNAAIIPISILTYYIFNDVQSDQAIVIMSLIALAALASFFKSFNVIDSYFQSQVKSKYVVKVQNIVLLISAFIKIALIILKTSVIWFGVALAIDGFMLAVGLVLIYNNQNHVNIKFWVFNWDRAISLLKQSWPLMLSAVMVSIYMKIDQVMLKTISGSQEVGYFSAAVKISEAWYFIPIAIVTSVFPAILSAYKSDKARYIKRLQNLYDLMVGISVPVAILISVLAGLVVRIVFGQEYLPSGLMLKIHIWSGIFVFLGSASSQYLLAEGYTYISLARTAAGAIVNILLNLWLIPLHGGVGASVATLIAYFTSAFFILFFKKTRQQGFMMLKSLFLISIVNNIQTYRRSH